MAEVKKSSNGKHLQTQAATCHFCRKHVYLVCDVFASMNVCNVSFHGIDFTFVLLHVLYNSNTCTDVSC